MAGDCCEAVGAIQVARPVNGDTSRPSVSEGSRRGGIARHRSRWSWGTSVSRVQSLDARACTTTRTANFGQGRVINASFMMI